MTSFALRKISGPSVSRHCSEQPPERGVLSDNLARNHAAWCQASQPQPSEFDQSYDPKHERCQIGQQGKMPIGVFRQPQCCQGNDDHRSGRTFVKAMHWQDIILLDMISKYDANFCCVCAARILPDPQQVVGVLVAALTVISGSLAAGKAAAGMFLPSTSS